MQYSNGYNNQVLPALFGRLAWNALTGLNGANATSKSGRYFDDGSFHSVVNYDTIKSVIEEQTDYNVYMTELQNAVISKALQSVFTVPEFKEQRLAYTPYDEKLENVVNNSNAVGYKITIADAFDIAHQINQLELYFNAANTFNVYLFKRGDKTPLKTKEVTTVANKKTIVSLANDEWFLSASEANVYYIIYFQNDLTGGTQAIKENVCFAQANHFKAESISTTTVAADFNRESPSTYYHSFGLNFKINVFKDFSYHILNQPYLFDELIGLQMAYNVIEKILYSTESDRKERILKGQLTEVGLQLDLKGAAPISDGPKTKGLQQRIEAEIARIKESFYPKPKAIIVNECY